MKKSEALVLVSILFLILVLSSSNSTIEKPEDILTKDPTTNKHQISNLVPHAPIIIATDNDFVSQGWPGSGSHGDPYIIEGLSIESEEYCIMISDTTQWFIIRNCSFVNTVDYTSYSLIDIHNAYCGLIMNCTFSDSRNSISLAMCSYMVISDSIFENVNYGIRIQTDCLIISIENNTFNSVTGNAIYVQYSARIHVNGNTFGECRTMISSYQVDYFEVSNNYQYSSIGVDSYRGIYSSGCTNSEIRNNTIIGDIRYGIYLSSCNDSIIQENYIDVEEYAISIYYLSNSSVGYNHFFSSFDIGAKISLENDLEFHHNNMDYLIVTGYFEGWTINFHDNVVMDRALGYFEGIQSTSFETDQYAQIFLIACNDIEIAIGVPIVAIRSSNIYIHDASFSDLHVSPISIYQTNRITIENINVENITDWSIIIESSMDCRIFDCHFQSFYSIAIYHSSDIVFENNVVDDAGSYYGITFSNVIYGKFQNNYVSGDSEINFVDCRKFIVQNNTLSESQIYISDSKNLTISANEIIGYTYTGLYVYESDGIQIVNNKITENQIGISLVNSYELYISGNLVANNEEVGLFCYGGQFLEIIGNYIYNNSIGIELVSTNQRCTIYLNEIGYNTESNAIDNGIFNKWDDDHELGNFWSDYSGSGSYTIEGYAGSEDQYPLLLEGPGIRIPILNHPIDFEFNEPSTGHVLKWTPNDSDPHSYVLYKNGIVFSSGEWNGSVLIFSLDYLEVGIWNFTLLVKDKTNRTASDTVFVTVKAGIMDIDTSLGLISLAVFGIEVVAVLVIILFLKRKGLRLVVGDPIDVKNQDHLSILKEQND